MLVVSTALKLNKREMTRDQCDLVQKSFEAANPLPLSAALVAEMVVTYLFVFLEWIIPVVIVFSLNYVRWNLGILKKYINELLFTYFDLMYMVAPPVFMFFRTSDNRVLFSSCLSLCWLFAWPIFRDSWLTEINYMLIFIWYRSSFHVYIS